MKHNPRIPEDEPAGWFIYNGIYYRVLIRNDDDEIPHYYLRDMSKEDRYCGFILNNNLTDPYHKDHHNFIFEDENLIKTMKDYLTSFTEEEKKVIPYEILKFYWELCYKEDKNNGR